MIDVGAIVVLGDVRVTPGFTTIEAVQVVSPFVIRILTKKPDPLLAARLAFYGGQIVPKKYVESVGNDPFNAKPVGTGPVRLTSWVKDDLVGQYRLAPEKIAVRPQVGTQPHQSHTPVNVDSTGL